LIRIEFKRYELVIVSGETRYRYYDLDKCQIAIYEIEESMGYETMEAVIYEEMKSFKKLNLIPVKTSSEQLVCDFISYNKIDKVYAKEMIGYQKYTLKK